MAEVDPLDVVGLAGVVLGRMLLCYRPELVASLPLDLAVAALRGQPIAQPFAVSFPSWSV